MECNLIMDCFASGGRKPGEDSNRRYKE
nr:MAG: hypothetical protein [Bacteriophage sp.]